MNPNLTMIESPRESNDQGERTEQAPASLSLSKVESAESVMSVDALVCYGIIMSD